MRISSHHRRERRGARTAPGYLRRVSTAPGRRSQQTARLLPGVTSLFGLFLFLLSCGKSTSPLSSQMGTFRSHDGDYFIEPLLSTDEQEDEEEQNKPHIIYRRSTPQREPSTGKHACDTSGICFLVKYT